MVEFQPGDVLNEAQLVFHQIHLIQGAGDLSSKISYIEDLEVLLSEHIDDEYRESVEILKKEYDDAREGARVPEGYDNDKLFSARYKLACGKWRSLMGVIARSGLKPRSSRI